MNSNNRALLGLVAVVVLVLGVAFTEAAVTNVECGLADDVTSYVGSAKSVPFITSSEEGTSNSPPHQMTNDVWFKVQSPCTDSIQFDLCNSQFDTIIAVYSGNACGANNTVDASQLINVNDDSRGACGAASHQSYLSISTRYGDKLYIRIGGFNGEQGTGSMKISCSGANVALEDDIVSISNIEDGGVIDKYLVKPLGWHNLINQLTFSMVTPEEVLPLIANGNPIINSKSITTSGSLVHRHGTVNWAAVSTLNTTNHKYQVSFSLSSVGMTLPKNWQLVASLTLNSHQPSNEVLINLGAEEIVLWQNTGFYFGYQTVSGHSTFYNSTVSSASSGDLLSLELVNSTVFTESYVYTGYEALKASLSVNLTTKSETSSSFAFYITPLPIVRNEIYTLVSNTDFTIDLESDGLLANDLAFRSKKLTTEFLSYENENHGNIEINPDGTFFYQPAKDFVGYDMISYLVIGDGSSTDHGRGVITFVVTPATVPQANNDTYVTKQNQTLVVNATIGLLANDTPADITIINSTLPTNGTLELNSDGSFTYTPNDLFVGNEVIAYTIQATVGLQVATGYLIIEVLPAFPVTTPDNYTMLQGSTLYVGANSSVLLNDIDPNNLELTAVVPDEHIAGLNFSSDGTFNYTPAVEFSGVVNFTYWAVNSEGLSTQSVVTIYVISVTPVAYNDSISVNQSSSVSGILRSDSADYVIVINGPFHNTSFSYNSTGEFTYTPSQSYTGLDYIEFVAFTNDGRNSSVGHLNITVLDVNFAPIALNDTYYVHENIQLKMWLNTPLLNDTDPDGDDLTFVLVEAPSNGTLTSFPNGTFIYTPSDGFIGEDHFTYQAFDNVSYSNIAFVTINVTDSYNFPVVLNENYTTSEDTLLVIEEAKGVLANDYDTDGHSLVAFIVSLPSHATTFEFYSNGSFIYLPSLNYNGYDSFSYNVSNGHVNVTGQARIYISTVNDLPRARNDSYTTKQNKVLYVPARGVLTNDTDPDQLRDLVVVDFVAPAHGSVVMHLNGSFEYTPNEDFVGVDTFEYIIKDSSDATASAFVSITVEKAGGATVIIIIIVIVLCVIAGALYFFKKRREAQAQGDDPQRLFS